MTKPANAARRMRRGLASEEALMEPTSDRVVESLLRLHQLTEAHPPESRRGRAPTSPPLTIALMREAGSQGSQIARAVGAQLDWPVYDQELLNLIAQDRGL